MRSMKGLELGRRKININPSGFKEFILSLQPTAYYPMNEKSGTTCIDIIGGNNGTYPQEAILGQPSLLSSDVDESSVLFNTSVNSFVSIPYTFTNTNFTVGCLCSIGLLSRVVLMQVNLTLSDNRAQLSYLAGNSGNSANRLAGLSQNVAFYIPNSFFDVGTNTLFIAMKLNNLTLSYFINGVKLIETNTSGNNTNPANRNNTIQFGGAASHASDNPRLSNFFFFNSALTDQQIIDIDANRF